ncbi:MAG: hypothetical protein ACYSW8_01635 [Planctomycetota bacterium]
MAAADPNQSRDDSIAQLKARISALEPRIEGLEKKLQISVPERSSTARGPSGSPRDQSHPRGWRRKGFNGVPYYVVPLDRKQSRPRQAISLKARR